MENPGKIVMDVEFQGGGLYDSRGQLIRAARYESGLVRFVDQSRGIYGEMHVSNPVFVATESAFQSWMMRKYLHNEYVGASFWPWWMD